MEKCKDCKFFVLHRYLIRNCRYSQTTAGHCGLDLRTNEINFDSCEEFQKANISPKKQTVIDLLFALCDVMCELKKVLSESDEE